MIRPYVLINVAMTADGKLDTVERGGATISSARDKERVDRLRAGVDAIMVGGQTLRGDDPQLLVKSPALRAARVARGLSATPAKVAVASRLDLPPGARFLTAGPARRIVFTTVQAAPAQVAALREQGVEVYRLGTTEVDLPAALDQLQALDIARVLVEGGGTLNFALLRLGLVDEVQIYIAALIFGGASAPTLAAGPGLPREAAIRLRRTAVEVWDEGGVVLHYALT